jgi:hypothetical protein
MRALSGYRFICESRFLIFQTRDGNLPFMAINHGMVTEKV